MILLIRRFRLGEAKDLSEIEVVPVEAEDELHFRSLMDERHYLGVAPKIGETIWYAARQGATGWPCCRFRLRR